MTNFYKLSDKEKFKRVCIGFPIGLLCVLSLYVFFGIPVWIILLFITIGVIQLLYYFLKQKTENK